MKRLFALIALSSALCACAQEQERTQIVAHRGMWKENAQNSLASLKAAQDFGCWGSEFDLHLTDDEVVVVNHDDIIGETKIQTSPLEEVRRYTLKNGEKIPLLDEYLKQGALSKCVLVLELKPHYKKERENILMDKCLHDERRISQMLKSEDAMELITALWTLGFYSAESALGAIKSIIMNGSRNQLLVAAYYNSSLYSRNLYSQSAEYVVETHSDDMELVAAFLPTYLDNFNTFHNIWYREDHHSPYFFPSDSDFTPPKISG